MNFWIVIFGVFLVACSRQTETLHQLTLISPTGQRVELRVEIADIPAARSRGLMFREELPDGRGMFFMFEKPQILRFWMKNTRIPLDILFFDEGGQLVSTATMEPCTADPCPTYQSAAEALYALEVTAGFVGQNGVGSGWRAFARQPSLAR